MSTMAERVARKFLAKKTFQAARDEILAHLKSKGWKIKEGLKIPYATSPDGDFRLWFKTQAVYYTSGNDHSFKGARSIHTDIRDMTPEKFLTYAQRWHKDASSDVWLTRAQVAQVCPSCAYKMASMGVTRVRASVLFDETNLRLAAKGDKWQGMPKGWDDSSRKKFWESLTGGVKHKVTKCIKQMEGKVDDPGAFCASLADRIEGKDWRSGE